MMTLDEMKKRKKELGYSNQRISELSGVSFGTVQKIFGGYTTAPRHETLAALDKVLSAPRVVYSKEDLRSDSDVLVLREDVSYDAFAKQKRLYTIDDYYALPDDVRVELIDGVFYDMAGPSYVHQMILGQLFIQFNECIRKHNTDCHVFFAPADVQLDRDIYTMVQPDLIIFCGMEDLRKRVYFGAPPFVVEILSPSTKKKDMKLKLKKYEEAGVEEAWFIDPGQLKTAVYQFKEKGDDCLLFPDVYTFENQIPLGISKGKCTIDFSQIYEEVKPLIALEE